MSTKLLLFLLPTLVYARININIRVSKYIEKSAAKALGSNTEVINDKEREVFRITEGALKLAIEKLSGGKPYHVFVRSPTPWNDLYETYDWNQVERTLEPIKAEIISLSSKPVTIFNQEFVNNSTANIKFNGELTQYVSDIITNEWTKSDQLYVDEKITYSIDIASDTDASTRVVYNSSWGEETITTKNISIGTLSGIELDISPGKAVLAALTASLVTIRVELEYTASLKGDVACNYPRPLKGHHFWAYDINDVLTANGLPKSVDSKEVLTIVFYTDAKVTFTDVKSSNNVVDKPSTR